jgi:hypothetical protein
VNVRSRYSLRCWASGSFQRWSGSVPRCTAWCACVPEPLRQGWTRIHLGWLVAETSQPARTDAFLRPRSPIGATSFGAEAIASSQSGCTAVKWDSTKAGRLGVGLVLVLVVLSGCSPRGEVRGSLVSEGGPPSPDGMASVPAPVAGEKVSAWQGGERVASVVTGATGSYQLHLPAGEYTLVFPCSGQVQITVTAGATVTVDRLCQIR